MLRKLNLIGVLVVFSTVIAAEGSKTALLTLRLGKDTLALAEPVVVTAEITNLTDSDLYITNDYMFNLIGSRLSLFLIMPDGEESSFRVNYSSTHPGALIKLPNRGCVSQQRPISWANTVPDRYSDNLINLPHGNYKLFATYRLPNQSWYTNVSIFSDTVDFVFLPLEEERREALSMMDSISDAFFSLFSNGDISGFERIRDTKTPYSEGAWFSILCLLQSDYESFKAEKARFDEVYPNSQFSAKLIEMKYESYLGVTTDIDSEADSLLRTARELIPNALYILRAREEVETCDLIIFVD